MQRWLGSCLDTSCGRLGAHSKRPGGGTPRTQKKDSNFKKSFKKNVGASRSPEGAPQMAASPIDCIFTMPRATARMTAYLQCRRAQGDIIHCKKCSRFIWRTSAGSKERIRSFLPFLEAPLVPQTAPGPILGNQKVATKIAASSIHCIFTMSRDHLDEARKTSSTNF